jgi:hypothetical protein
MGDKFSRPPIGMVKEVQTALLLLMEELREISETGTNWPSPLEGESGRREAATG